MYALFHLYFHRFISHRSERGRDELNAVLNTMEVFEDIGNFEEYGLAHFW